MSIELKQAAQQAVDAFDAFGDADDFASLFELTQKVRALRTAIQQAEAQQSATGELVKSFAELREKHRAGIDAERAKLDAAPEPAKAERDQLRCAQADAVMPLIGPLLDAWENAGREVISQEPELSRQLKAINNAMEGAQPATGEPAVSRNPFASRCYTMSESHLSGHRLIVGFEELGGAQDAHEWVTRQVRGDFTNPAPSVPADVVRDAERYRFIRDADVSDDLIPDIALYAMESLDEYIDAAMLAAK